MFVSFINIDVREYSPYILDSESNIIIFLHHAILLAS